MRLADFATFFAAPVNVCAAPRGHRITTFAIMSDREKGASVMATASNGLRTALHTTARSSPETRLRSPLQS